MSKLSVIVGEFDLTRLPVPVVALPSNVTLDESRESERVPLVKSPADLVARSAKLLPVLSILLHAMLLPFHEPVLIVPRFVILVEPTQVDKAVSSTLERPTVPLSSAAHVLSPR